MESMKATNIQQQHTWALAVLLINVALYSLCYMAQVPVLPYILQKLGSDAVGYGKLQSFFGVVQFFGGLLSGPLVDKYGGKTMLLLSFGSSALSYWIVATANHMWMLYLSRLASLLQHAVLATRTVVTGITPPSQRAAVLGYTSTAMSLGFALGPALGGMLSEHSLTMVAWIATAGSVLSFASILFLLPGGASPHTPTQQGGSTSGTPLPKPDPSHDVITNGTEAANPQTSPNLDKLSASSTLDGKQPLDPRLGPSSHGTPRGDLPQGGEGAAARLLPSRRSLVGELLAVCGEPGVGHLLGAKLLGQLGPSIFQSSFSLMLQDNYALGAKGNGLVLSYVGILNMISQGVLVPYTARRFPDAQLIKASAALLLLGFAVLWLGGGLPGLLLSMVPLAAGGALFSTVNTAQLTKAVPTSRAGSVMALDMSIFSGVRMLSPTVGAYMAASFGYSSIAASAAALSAVLVASLELRWLLPDVAHLHPHGPIKAT